MAIKGLGYASWGVTANALDRSHTDGSYARFSASERARRREQLQLPHIVPLTAFVEAIRTERALGTEVPFFDPLDSGTHALFLLEALGPKAVDSGFIRDKPDPTARN